ncbi:MAG TPA: ParA family protein [Alphaproteobacteria bacterium]|nr:ParA family protein [Alphaproteobacteria bacterium]
MRVLTFASQKGGSGKTTLAGHVAVEIELAGAGRVALIDTDPQGSLADWWNARHADWPAFAHTSVNRLKADLEELAKLGVDYAVIDTPPAITSTIHRVIEISDLVVIPTRPSPHDLRAAGATVELVKSLGKNMTFVVNGATPRARITAEAAIALSQHGTVAPVTIHQRTDFAASMIDGRTVMELDSRSRSSGEIGALWRYLATRLHGVYRDTVLEMSQGALEPREDAGESVEIPAAPTASVTNLAQTGQPQGKGPAESKESTLDTPLKRAMGA